MFEAITARIVLVDGWRRAALAFLMGALLTLGLPPYNFPAVGFVSFPVFVLLIDGAAGTPGRSLVRRLAPAFRVGWCFGFGYFVGGLWWLGAAMTVEGNAFLWAIPFAVLVLPAIVAVYFGLAAMLARAAWSDGPARILALAASLALFEYLRGRLFTGFPWNELGVIAAPTPLLMQSLSVVGLHGLTLAAVIVFAAPAALLARRGRRGFVLLAVLIAAAHAGFGAWRLAGRADAFVPNLALRVVQPNILQGEKWDAAEAERIFARLLTLTGKPSADAAPATTDPTARTLIVWPESAFPFFLTERPDAVARLADAIQPGEMLLAGAARPEVLSGAEPRYYNSIYAIDDNGEIVDARDKTHLVPFGEYLPFEGFLKTLGIRQLAELPGGFSPGASRKPVALPGLPTFLPLICYEIIFQDEIDTRRARPDFIVNLTNDAWYGDTPGPYQHLRQAELTAVALGLPLVRAANTGISVVSDAYGVVADGLAFDAAGVVEARLPAGIAATVFARMGNAVFWIALALAGGIAIIYSVINTRVD